ncbi:MAG: dihydrofolate reductase [Clostridia bacterium]|nr:dihydrofolate reductase [Clostridia bacterium]
MDLIVAVDLDWGIGKDNDLLFHIPEDMKFFRATTIGKTVVLGRKTLESFPGGKPLPGRRHLVLTRQDLSPVDNLTVLHDLSELDMALGEIDGEVYLIGGASLYRQLYDRCRFAFVTRILERAEADAFFPDLDADPSFELVSEGEVKESTCGVRFQFLKYKNKRF